MGSPEWKSYHDTGFLCWYVFWPEGLNGNSGGALRQHMNGRWQVWDPVSPAAPPNIHWVDAPNVSTLEEAQALALVLHRMGGHDE